MAHSFYIMNKSLIHPSKGAYILHSWLFSYSYQNKLRKSFYQKKKKELQPNINVLLVCTNCSCSVKGQALFQHCEAFIVMGDVKWQNNAFDSHLKQGEWAIKSTNEPTNILMYLESICFLFLQKHDPKAHLTSRQALK